MIVEKELIDRRAAPRSWGRRWLPAAAIAALVAIVYVPSVTNPLRLWDHHVILLLAKAPQFADGLFWHLFHYRVGFQEDVIYFRVLSMPTVYGLAWLFQDHAVLYHVTHLLAHFLVTVVLYRLARELSGQTSVALLLALLFAVYSGHGDTVNIPHYTFMFIAMALAGLGMLWFIRHVETGDERNLVVAAASLGLATLVYDAFLLVAIALPLLAVGIPWRAGTLTRGRLATAGGVLLGTVGLLVLVVLSLRFSPVAASLRTGAVRGSLGATLSELLVDHRVVAALGYGAWGLLSDLLLFVSGHFPSVWHRGNMPYWEIDSIRQLGWTVLAALALSIAAAAVFRFVKRPWNLVAVALVAAGAVIDAKTLPLAAVLGILCFGGVGGAFDKRLLVVAVAGALASVNIALGRADGYNVMALRHHYITGFFVVGVLAGLVGSRWQYRPAWQRHGLLVALGVCVVANGWVTVRMLEDVKKNNEMVFSFDRGLTAMVERHGPGSLFATFSTSFVRGHDWHTSPAQDVVFDVLHYHQNPLTRYVNRAPFVIRKDGIVMANPFRGRSGDEDFAFEFRLIKLPAGRFELFGSSPNEPRIVLEAPRLSFLARRRLDGTRVARDFTLPSDLRFPVLLRLSRSGRSLQLAVNGATVGPTPLSESDAYHGWQSDNAGLLGRDFERILASYALYDTYIRIGDRGVDDVS
jgi:hypothetical protein